MSGPKLFPSASELFQDIYYTVTIVLSGHFFLTYTLNKTFNFPRFDFKLYIALTGGKGLRNFTTVFS